MKKRKTVRRSKAVELTFHKSRTVHMFIGAGLIAFGMNSLYINFYRNVPQNKEMMVFNFFIAVMLLFCGVLLFMEAMKKK